MGGDREDRVAPGGAAVDWVDRERPEASCGRLLHALGDEQSIEFEAKGGAPRADEPGERGHVHPVRRVTVAQVASEINSSGDEAFAYQDGVGLSPFRPQALEVDPGPALLGSSALVLELGLTSGHVDPSQQQTSPSFTPRLFPP